VTCTQAGWERSMPDRVVLGVDGGGTKTDALVIDGHGRVLGYGASGGANWEGVGLDGMARSIREAVDRAMGSAAVRGDQLAATAFALAGIDWPSDPDRVAPSLDMLALGGGPRSIVNDSFAALRAGSTASHGIVSIAGTGGVTAGRNRAGQVERTMGIGIGEGNGASGLFDMAVQAIGHVHNGTGPHTMLTEEFLSESGCATTTELFETLSRKWTLATGEYAPAVIRCAAAGDQIALDICRRSGRTHGRDVVGIARRLGLADDTFDLVLAGGIHVSLAAHFTAAFHETVGDGAPGARPVRLAAPPASGAALLALELIGVDADSVRAMVNEGAAAARAAQPLTTGESP